MDKNETETLAYEIADYAAQMRALSAGIDGARKAFGEAFREASR